MLESIRKHSRGWIAKTIIGLIVVSFAAFGVEQFFQNDGAQATVLAINDRNIDAYTFSQLLQSNRRLLAQQYKVAATAIPQQQLEQYTVNQAISQTLYQQKIAALELTASQAEFEAAIVADERFHINGGFDEDAFTNAARGQSWPDFKSNYTSILASQQLDTAVLTEPPIVDKQIYVMLRLLYQKRSFDMIKLPLHVFLDGVAADETRSRAYYETNTAQYFSDEKVQIEYIQLSREDLSADAWPTDEELQSALADRQQQQPAAYNVSHILLTADGSDALVNAEKVYTQLTADPSQFADIASKQSIDTVSANTGGDLGDLRIADMDPAFVDQIQFMEVAEISPPILTDFGYHLIRLNSIKQAKDIDSDNLTETIRQALHQQKMDDTINTLAEELADATFAATTLEEPAKQFGYTVQKSGFFSQVAGNETVTKNSNVRALAFSDKIKNAGQTSDIVTLANGHKLVFRVIDIQDSAQQPYAAVRHAVAKDWRQSVATTQRNALISSINDTTDISTDATVSLSEYPSLAWQTITESDSQVNPDVSADVLQFVFGLAANTKNSMQQYSSNNTTVLIKLTNIHYPDKNSLIDAQRLEMTQYLERTVSENTIYGFNTSLRNNATIVDRTDRTAEALAR